MVLYDIDLTAQRQRSPGRPLRCCKAEKIIVAGSGASTCWADGVIDGGKS